MKWHCVYQHKPIANFLPAFRFSFFGGAINRLWRNTIFWINNKLQQTFKGWKYENPYGAA